MSGNVSRSNSNRRLQRIGTSRQPPRVARPTSQFPNRDSLSSVNLDPHLASGQASSSGHSPGALSDAFTLRHFGNAQQQSMQGSLNFTFCGQTPAFPADQILDFSTYIDSSPRRSHSHNQGRMDESKDIDTELEGSREKESVAEPGSQETIAALRSRIAELEYKQQQMKGFVERWYLPALRKASMNEDTVFSIDVEKRRLRCENITLRRRLTELDRIGITHGLQEQNYYRGHQAGNFFLLFSPEMEQQIAEETEVELRKQHQSSSILRNFTSTTTSQRPPSTLLTAPAIPSFPQPQYQTSQVPVFYQQAGPATPSNTPYAATSVQGTLDPGLHGLAMEQIQAFQGSPYLQGHYPGQFGN